MVAGLHAATQAAEPVNNLLCYSPHPCGPPFGPSAASRSTIP